MIIPVKFPIYSVSKSKRQDFHGIRTRDLRDTGEMRWPAELWLTTDKPRLKMEQLERLIASKMLKRLDEKVKSQAKGEGHISIKWRLHEFF